MDVPPRFDVYRSYKNPENVVATAYGTWDGKMRVLALEFDTRSPDNAEYATDEAKLRADSKKMLEFLWDEGPVGNEPGLDD